GFDVGPDAMAQRLSDWLLTNPVFVAPGYPYDVALLYGAQWDNALTDERLVDNFEEFRRRYAYPRIVAGRAEDFFRDVERRFGSGAPPRRAPAAWCSTPPAGRAARCCTCPAAPAGGSWPTGASGRPSTCRTGPHSSWRGTSQRSATWRWRSARAHPTRRRTGGRRSRRRRGASTSCSIPGRARSVRSPAPT